MHTADPCLSWPLSSTTQLYNYDVPNDRSIALIIIDIQRDFLEPQGLGETLGDVSLTNVCWLRVQLLAMTPGLSKRPWLGSEHKVPSSDGPLRLLRRLRP